MQSDGRGEVRSNEIDLAEIVKVIWLKKWLVLIITLAVALVFSMYAFLAKPVYEAKFYMSPPTLDDVANLNYGRTGELKPFTVDYVYKIFLRNLQSQSLLQSFYREVYISSFKEKGHAESIPESYDRFSSRVSIASLDKDPMGRWSLSIQGHDPKTITHWVSIYTTSAAQLAQREVVSNATKEASVLARNLKLQIDSLREAGKQLREDSILRLSESLAVAKASGLDKTVVFVGEDSSKLAGDMEGGAAYMRGTKALEAELKNLKGRESNDPFIPDLRKLQAEYEFYKGIELDNYKVSVFRPDGDVQEPVSPLKPKKIMLVLLGIILGGLTGIVVALITSYRSARFIE